MPLLVHLVILIIDSTEVSGSNDFEEIVDADALNGPLDDPLRDQLQAIAADSQ